MKARLRQQLLKKERIFVKIKGSIKSDPASARQAGNRRIESKPKPLQEYET